VCHIVALPFNTWLNIKCECTINTISLALVGKATTKKNIEIEHNLMTSLILTSQKFYKKKRNFLLCLQTNIAWRNLSQYLLQRRRSDRASERENERESKIVITKVFEVVFARVQGARCKVQRQDSLMTHRVWPKSSIIFVSHHQKSQRYYYQGAADMVLGLSWGQLALVLGASVALFGKVSSYDLSLLQAWLLGLKLRSRTIVCLWCLL
jgi:hypothetical protein